MNNIFNSSIEKNNQTDNIIYNIINTDDPKYIFMYGIFIIGFIFISTKINYNINILIGLIFYSLVIYYFYTWKNNNDLFQSQIKKEKFNYCKRSKPDQKRQYSQLLK